MSALSLSWRSTKRKGLKCFAKVLVLFFLKLLIQTHVLPPDFSVPLDQKHDQAEACLAPVSLEELRNAATSIPLQL